MTWPPVAAFLVALGVLKGCEELEEAAPRSWALEQLHELQQLRICDEKIQVAAAPRWENNAPPLPKTDVEVVRSKAPKVLENASAEHQHGRLGLFRDGSCCKLEPVPLPARGLSKKERLESHRGFSFSSRDSEAIDVDRVQDDVRSDFCKARQETYPCHMPKASVVMVFHNEHMPTLLRSVHSVLNLSPAQLLEEGPDGRAIPMLQRCAVSNACCPKLSEEDFTGFNAFGNTQMYLTPFMYDPSAPHGQEVDDLGDFPPGALALMYDPPIDDDLDSPSDWTNESDWTFSAPSGSRPALQRIDVDNLEQSIGITVPQSRGALPGRALSATPNGLGAHGLPSTSFGPTSRSEILKPLVADAGVAAAKTNRRVSLGDDEHSRTFSRSVREAQTCTSEVGAASIAAILECVEQAQDVPRQQRPNSEKWSERLRTFEPKTSRCANVCPLNSTKVLLVDDDSRPEAKKFSERQWKRLQGELEELLVDLPKVSLIRLRARRGLMKARMEGIWRARGEVVVCLDSHIETTPGWLEPLLWRITEDRTRVVVPSIDGIDTEDFRYEVYGLGLVSFNWLLNQKPRERPEGEDTMASSSVLCGGLFAVDRSWFLHLGGYDPELQIYGGEEMEIGFAAWQCGGSVVHEPHWAQALSLLKDLQDSEGC
eukprot:s645_g32.t3